MAIIHILETTVTGYKYKIFTLQEARCYPANLVNPGLLNVSGLEWLQELSDVYRKQDNIQGVFRLVVRIMSASQETRVLQSAVDQKVAGIAQVLLYGCDGTIHMNEPEQNSV